MDIHGPGGLQQVIARLPASSSPPGELTGGCFWCLCVSREAALTHGYPNGYIATLPEWRSADGFLTFMSFGYMIMCSGASVAVIKAVLVP